MSRQGRQVRHMQVPTSTDTDRTGWAAISNGFLFGAIAAVVYIVSAIIQDITGTTVALVTTGSAFTPFSLLNQVSLIAALVLFFVAGFRTARDDSKLSSAAGAGLIVALIVSSVEIGTIIVNQGLLYRTTIATLAHEKRLTTDGFHFLMFLNPASGALLTLIIYVALGTGLAFVAGILQAQLRQQELWR